MSATPFAMLLTGSEPGALTVSGCAVDGGGHFEPLAAAYFALDHDFGRSENGIGDIKAGANAVDVLRGL